MILDAHTHIDDQATYQSYKTKTRGLFDRCLVLHWFKDDLLQVADFVASKPDLKLIASVDVDGPEHMARQLALLEELFQQSRIVGIKLYPGYQHFYVSEERIRPVAELCIRYDKPLVIHAGDVYDEDNEAILKYSHPSDIDELAVRFPKLKIVIAHFGFPHLLECANIVSKNENVYTDISGTLCEGAPSREKRAMFKEYYKDLRRVFNYFPNIKNKVMFGTDYDWNDATHDDAKLSIKLVKKLFSRGEQKSVFADLAQKLFLDSTL